MKKIFTLLLALVAVLTLSACKDKTPTPPGPTGPTDQELVDAAIAAVTLGDLDLAEVLNDFDLPVSHENGATFTWHSDNTTIITIDGTTNKGMVTRPAAGEEDVTVTLTATAVKGTKTKTTTFSLVVTAVPGGVSEKLAEAKKSLRIDDILDLDGVVETAAVLPTISPLYPEVQIIWTIVSYEDMLPTEPTKPTGYVSADADGRDAWYIGTVYLGCMLDVTDDLTGAADTLDETHNILSKDFVSYKDSSNPFTDGTAFTTGIPEANCGWSAYKDAPGGQDLLVEHGVWDASPSYDEDLKAATDAYDAYEADVKLLETYDPALLSTVDGVGITNLSISRPASANGNVRLVAMLKWVDEGYVVETLEKEFNLVITQAPQDDLTKVTEAKEALKLFGIDFVDANFTLPTTGLYDAAITWASGTPSVLSINNENVTLFAPSNNTAVTLTATITVGTETMTKSFVAVAVGTEATYTYRTSISDTTNINPHNETLSNASTLYGLITAGLYNGDFDWDASIAAGTATAVGDYTNSASLAYDRFPYMAVGDPVDVSDDSDMTKWEITLRDDLAWEDGTAIDADDFLYAYKMLLDPRLINARAGGFYTDLKIVGAEAYAKQDVTGIAVDGDYTISFDTVGVAKDGQYKLVFELSTPTTAWDLKGNLMSGISGPVHEGLYEAGMNETRTVTDYGSTQEKIMSYGAYVMTTWEPGVVYIYAKNPDFFDADSYRIEYVRYDVIEKQSVSVNEFKAGRLDVAGVSGTYYPEFKNNPNVLLSPATTTFRWATNIGERADGNTNPMMSLVDFRRAIYHAVDRQEMVATVNAPALAQQALLSPEYIITDTSTQSYRGSLQGQSVIADLSPDTAGYNPTQALAYFNAAYAQAVTAGTINDGDMVWVELAMKDAETNWTTNNWVKDVVTKAFDAQPGGTNEGKFEFRIAAYSTDALDVAEANADFDIMFYGWTGLKFDPISLMGYVWNENFNYMNEKGWTPGTFDIEADLTNYFATLDAEPVMPVEVTEPTEVTAPDGYVAVDADGRAAWYDALDTAGQTAATEYDTYLVAVETYEDYMAEKSQYDWDKMVWDGSGTITQTFHQWFQAVNPGGKLYADYDGMNADYLNICAAMEGKLISEVIGIPLFTSVGTAVYSDRVVHEVKAYHAWMAWGDLRHMYLNAPDGQ
jgi:ABC-type transport system substrate-binding protein